MRCVVTGANGFMGAHVVRALLARGHEVVAAVGTDVDTANLEGLPVETRELDLLESPSVRRCLEGAEAIFHTAAIYSFWMPEPALIYRVNVEGTRRVLEAAAEVRAERVVYTSSTATLTPSFGEVSGAEDAVYDARRFQGHYKVSKTMAETLVLRAAARGLPATIVHPTTVVGRGDRRPTPTGTMMTHFLKGHMKAYVDTMLNVVDVADVAEGQVLAFEQGLPGERYVLGGENLTMREVLAIFEDLTGIPAPRFAIPHPLLTMAGAVGEWLADHVTHRSPMIERESALHARSSSAFSIAKARKELGYAPAPARLALARALSWFLGQGEASASNARRVVEHGVLARELGGDTPPLSP